MPKTKKPVYASPSKLWKGIAIAGVWIGTGISAMYCGIFVVAVAIFAMFATTEIAKAN